MELFESFGNEDHMSINDMQFCFMPRKTTNDIIFIMRQIQEKYQEKKTLYYVFVDLGKDFERVPRDVMIWSLRKRSVNEWLIRIVMALCTKTC